MKISEMIKNLQKFMGQHGDLDCWYAVDDEGNEYHEVGYTPSLYYVNEYGEVVHPEDAEEYDEEDMKYLVPVCIVN